MKKKLLGTLLAAIFISGGVYAEGFNVKVGSLFNQTLENTYNENSIDLDNGYNIDLSYDFKLGKHGDFGLGYELVSSDLKYDDGKTLPIDFSSNPFYAQFKYNFNRDQRNNFYLLCKIGANLIDDEESSTYETGGYFGLGIGVELGHFIIQLTADARTASYTVYSPYSGSSEESLVNSRANLSIGFNLGRDYKTNKNFNNNIKTIQKDISVNNNYDKSPSPISKKLTELKKLKDQGLITDEEYSKKRKEILDLY